MSKYLSAKTYQKVTTYLLNNLNSSNELSLGHIELARAVGIGRTTLVLAIKKMREKDPEWEVLSGGNDRGKSVVRLTTYRFIGNK